MDHRLGQDITNIVIGKRGKSPVDFSWRDRIIRIMLRLSLPSALIYDVADTRLFRVPSLRPDIWQMQAD